MSPFIPRVGHSGLAALLAAALSGCGPPPEIPTLLRDVHLTDADLYTYAVVPPFRTSADGRIAVDMKKRSPELYLLSPEKLSGPVTAPGAAAGTDVVAQAYPPLTKTDFYDPGAYLGLGGVDAAHRTICDGTPQFGYGADTVLNPHPCDPSDPRYDDPIDTTQTQDCYLLTMITIVEFDDGVSKKAQPWGTPVTVVVDNPKRWGDGADAVITDVEIGDPVDGQVFHAGSLFEPMVTDDGRLLVGRLAKSARDPNTGANRPSNLAGDVDRLDVVYSTYPEEAGRCDVTRWTTLHPITYAYHDPDMQGRYGIAAYELRDPLNNVVDDGADAEWNDLQVSYPWIDRDGDNLFFTTVRATLFNDDGNGSLTIRHFYECYDPGCTVPTDPSQIADFETLRNFQGYGFAGLWSHGKMVLLDNVTNNVDYGLGRGDDEQVLLKLYEPGTNPDPAGDQSGWARSGTGRDNGPFTQPLTTENANFIDSLENLFNYDDHLKPLTVRDVVWTMNTGKVSAELAFDDYLDPNALIVAEMSGALEHTGLGGVYLHYWDGFDQTAGPPPSGVVPVVAGREEVRFQNAATAVPADWDVPPFGRGLGGVRLEPVALGGIEGKGAWLDGDGDAIEFDVPAQPADVTAHAWYLGLFVDSRFDDDARRQLVVFPDGSELVLAGRHTLDYEDAAGAVAHSTALGGLELKHGGWSHLGLVLDFPGNETKLYVDGFRVDLTAGVPFALTPGLLYLGDAPDGGHEGFRGWVDEFKLFAYEPAEEVKCNHARGTLMGITPVTGEPWQSLAPLYPGSAHQAISAELAANGFQPYSQYVCYHDYDQPMNASPQLATDPELFPLRHCLVFPEKPLRFDVERPDSSSNAFCLTCHHAAGRHGLGLAALDPGAPGVELQNDPRRQPMMPPRVMFGNVPVYYFGSGPDQHLSTVDHLIDRYVFPEGGL